MAENIAYAEMASPTGKGKGREKTNAVHLQDDSLHVTYAAIKKPPGKKDNYTKQRGQLEENTYVMVRGDPDPTDWKLRLFRGRRCYVILVTFLVALGLGLLIVIVSTRTVSCPGDPSMAGCGPGPSSTADSSCPCPDPWIHVTNKCYFFSENRKTRKDSEEDCKNRTSRLATVKEGTILRLVALTEQDFWIGLESIGTHHSGGMWTGRWADGSTVNITEGSGGSCAKIKRKLIIHNCQEELHWICEWDVPAA